MPATDTVAHVPPTAQAMRHGRLKRIRRALTFYKVCYQFREPYKARPEREFYLALPPPRLF